MDAASESAREYRTLLQKRNLGVQHPAFKLWAYVAGEILMEGLRQAGRVLTREKLVNALEGLYEFRTGLAPPISFGPNHRIGALGAYVFTVNPEKKEFQPVSEWISPN